MCYAVAMKFIWFLSLLHLLYSLRVVKSESILIIVLPQSDSDTKESASWERGEEILPGACAAIEEAKNDSLSFNLTLIMANSSPVPGNDLPYSGNMLEVMADLTWQKRASDIIGIAGVLHPNVLAVLSRLQAPIASLINFDEAKALRNSHIHYLTASKSMLADSILAFLREIHPRKIGTITETKWSYSTVANQLSTKVNLSVIIQIDSNHRKSLSAVVNRVFASNVHVILLSAGPSLALSVLCEAYITGLTWPKYAWILHSYRLDDLLQNSKSVEGCSVRKILEGIFIFQLTKEESYFCTEAEHCNMNNGGFNNPYAELLYDSVWSLISSANSTSFHSNMPHLYTNGSKVYVYHSMNGTANFISTYDGISHTSSNVSEVMFTDYDLPVVQTEALLYPYLLPLPILCLLFNTVLLILYIYFRNEPNIKSTSAAISMLIFVGCYFLIVSSIILVLHRPYRLDLCLSLIWIYPLSFPLILATILVKMLRVYHIFTVFKTLKQSAKCKDFALIIYSVLILSPLILLQTIWTAIDPYHLIINLIENPGFIGIDVRCHSHYTHIWLLVGNVYLILLSAAVIIVAVKSRKIRRAHFKDTKKVNLFIFIYFILGTLCFPHIVILDYMGYHSALLYFFYLAYIIVAIFCQLLLFVPKIWPSIQNKIFKVLDASRKSKSGV